MYHELGQGASQYLQGAGYRTLSQKWFDALEKLENEHPSNMGFVTKSLKNLNILRKWLAGIAGSMIYLANVLLAQDTTSAARMSPSVAWPELLIF